MTRSPRAPAKATPQPLVKPPNRSWRDHLCVLLHVGAEIEHALLVEYLYSAYSLGGEQVPAAHRPAVERWQNAMLTVAREEMGHLMSVQNLLTLLGGPISFARDDYPFDTPYYPFPFHLGPLTFDSLSRYVYAEKPLSMPDDASPTEIRVAKAVTRRIEREVEHPHPVGEIYGEILEILGDSSKIPDSAFHPHTFSRQASWEEWGKGYRPQATPPNAVLVDERRQRVAQDTLRPSALSANVLVAQMGTRTEALAAVHAIAAQGEAPHLRRRRDPGEPSHFERFVDVYVEFERVKGWTPTRDVPVNPTTLESEASKDQTFIESSSSRTWAQLFNLRYRLALTWLTHVFSLANDTASGRRLRGPTLHRIFGEMYNLKTIAGILVRSPLTDSPRDARRAGPPFEMPYTLALPTADVDCWGLERELLETSLALGASLAGQATGDGARYLATLAVLDRQAIAWIDQVLAGARADGRAARR